MSHATSQPSSHKKTSRLWLVFGLLGIALVIAGAFYRQWLPHLQRLASANTATEKEGAKPNESKPADSHDHAGHDHAGHDDANSIKMSEQARKNIGLQVIKMELQDFAKAISVPGMVVERPGLSTIEITAPMTGVITRIYPIEGEAIEPGAKLFELRLTHEELVQSQSELLQTAEGLDVIAREIARIEKLTEDGGLAGKQLLERKYEQQKQEAVLRSERQALFLHGLSEAQVEGILTRRELLTNLTVSAPSPATNGTDSPMAAVYQVQSLRAVQGRQVLVGETLAVLADHAELYIQGEAFERDLPEISLAAANQVSVSAILESEGGKSETIPNLRIFYLADKVNPEARTLDFFVTLPNKKQRGAKIDGDHRFISWKFRPGQRVQLRVPVETLPKRIVLPVDALAQEGVETYVFTPNGDHFDRRNVHVEYRDTQWVVLANDGSLFPGDLVASSGAQQLQLALKNKSGGGIDPHAGHNH